MFHRRCLVAVACTLLGLAVVVADEPQPLPLVDRLWTITDTILDRHVNPTTRQEMLLAAVRGIAARSGKEMPPQLAQRISKVATREQFAELLKELALEPGNAESIDTTTAAMLSAVPGKPSLIPPAALKSVEQLADNRYVGTGIQVRMEPKENLVQIVVPFPGSPARRAGSKPNDLILSVDGVDMKGKKLMEVVEILRGPEGSKVSVVVRQPTETTTRTLNMIRTVIPFQNALGCKRLGEESWEFRPDPAEPLAFIRLSNITSSTPGELAQLEKRLKNEGAKGLVLDLRTANGTHFQPLLLLADSLLDGGVIWKSWDSRHRMKEHKADRDCLFRDLPLAVLVDVHSDPVPVLLAAALQDRGRAVIVGETPKSSGWVTSLVTLPNDLGGLMLRTGMVQRTKAPPDGPIHLSEDGGWQLYPDQEVSLTQKQREEVFTWHSDQERLLEDKGGKMPSDPQLSKALAMLRKAIETPARKDTKEP